MLLLVLGQPSSFGGVEVCAVLGLAGAVAAGAGVTGAGALATGLASGVDCDEALGVDSLSDGLGLELAALFAGLFAGLLGAVAGARGALRTGASATGVRTSATGGATVWLAVSALARVSGFDSATFALGGALGAAFSESSMV